MIHICLRALRMDLRDTPRNMQHVVPTSLC